MTFFNLENHNLAIITTQQKYHYNEIPSIEFIHSKKQLILILCQNTIDVLTAYVSGLNSGHSVMLLSADINSELLNDIVNKYKPYWIVGLERYEGYTSNFNKLVREIEINVEIHSDLAILLSTSGTTGSQKFVRLSYSNIRANAQSIIEYLEISEQECAVMNLPLSYSYGMSIVNSHLLAGASILLTDMSVMEKPFWELVKEHKATSLAGVPFTYQMLHRVGFMKMDLPHLKVLTQAGGRLNEKFVQAFGEYAKEHSKRFYIMYGQTEAAPRMSYIPYDKVLEKSGTIGIAIPAGQLSVEGELNELVYRGANVMMGYAECLADLAKGDEMQGVLHTGDTATVDEEGYFTITGRIKRFIKLFGLRINLDEVEKKLEEAFHIPLACTGSDDKLIVAIEQESAMQHVKEAIESLYKLHKTAYKVVLLDAIPRFANGKTDYTTLKERCL
ncbi:AMP-binding protein [Metasolibacillus meyeri]|uniref:AMP-binding protein n=1 Tax=Metasolibacillus meyeri TaxID=1071052 RepID=UPI000D309D7A|nr:AMP-binding protein [Metasolibacillus meyeri]